MNRNRDKINRWKTKLGCCRIRIASKGEKVEALGLSNSSTNQEDEAIVAVELLINERKRGATDCIDYDNGWL